MLFVFVDVNFRPLSFLFIVDNCLSVPLLFVVVRDIVVHIC